MLSFGTLNGTELKIRNRTQHTAHSTHPRRTQSTRDARRTMHDARRAQQREWVRRGHIIRNCKRFAFHSACELASNCHLFEFLRDTDGNSFTPGELSPSRHDNGHDRHGPRLRFDRVWLLHCLLFLATHQGEIHGHFELMEPFLSALLSFPLPLNLLISSSHRECRKDSHSHPESDPLAFSERRR